jgi:hypothetical protein
MLPLSLLELGAGLPFAEPPSESVRLHLYWTQLRLNSGTVGETPGTATLAISGHWEEDSERGNKAASDAHRDSIRSLRASKKLG